MGSMASAAMVFPKLDRARTRTDIRNSKASTLYNMCLCVLCLLLSRVHEQSVSEQRVFEM